MVLHKKYKFYFTIILSCLIYFISKNYRNQLKTKNQLGNKLGIKLETKEKSDEFIYNLRINHLKQPFGIDIKGNSFSFLSKEEGPFIAALLLNNKIIEIREVYLNESYSFYFENDLEYNKIYKYVVEGNTTRNELEFETALDLKAPFIKPENKELFSPIFVKNFNINKDVKRARLYITGLGLYQAYINDNKVGNGYLTPGFNDYDYYLRYQVYNITQLLSAKNKIEVHMGDGWYKGRFGMSRVNNYNIYGDEYKLCAEILIEYNDKTILNILTDESWKVKSSREISNGIYDGEVIDFTLPEKPLEKVKISNEKYNLTPDFGALIVEKEILHPVLYISPKGEQILDFKQNMVGFVRFKGFLKKNQEIKISHGEILQNKIFFNRNLKSAKAMLKYKGDGNKRVYEPKFTYSGFRYALVEGLDKVNPEEFEGVVIYTDLEKTIECQTDNKKINQLIQNAFWGQRGNFLDVPTDCPQRDERLGWTGDTQVFFNTACYNMDTYLFYKKYMKDLRGDQTMYYNGEIPCYSPSLKHQNDEAGAVWADAATILPWNYYLNYGDKKILDYFYPLMKDYVETLINKDIQQGNKNLILEGFTYGDWLALDGDNPNQSIGGTDNRFIMSVYYYHSIDLISLASEVLGKKDEYKRYSELKGKIYKSILDFFFSDNGKLKFDTQTSYILCLHYKIYKNKDIIIRDFKERIKNDFFHIKTGFTGTPLFLLTLFDNDMDDYAYRLLYNEDFPGWLYAVNLGATTIWERWNSLLPDGTISGTFMNSFNHYSYGSVCESIYSRIAGLRNICPGWKKVIVKPQLNYRMKKLDFSYESISGKYEIFWKWLDTRFSLRVTVPYGCEAEIILPNGISHNVKDGTYNYECDLEKNIYNPFSIDTPIFDLIKYNQSNRIIKDLLPKLYEKINKKNKEIEKYSIKSAISLFKLNYTSEIIKKCNSELSQIKP